MKRQQHELPVISQSLLCFIVRAVRRLIFFCTRGNWSYDPTGMNHRGGGHSSREPDLPLSLLRTAHAPGRGVILHFSCGG